MHPNGRQVFKKISLNYNPTPDTSDVRRPGLCSSALCVGPRPPAHVTALGPLAMAAHERGEDFVKGQVSVSWGSAGGCSRTACDAWAPEGPLNVPRQGSASSLPRRFFCCQLGVFTLCCAVSPDLLSSASPGQTPACPRKPSCCRCYLDWRGPILSH